MTEDVPQGFIGPTDGREAMLLVAKTTGPWNWAFVGADATGLPLAGGGPGSVSEMRNCLATQRKHAVMFGLCRVLVGTGNMRRTRHVFVIASHEEAGFGAMATGRAMLARGAMEKVIHQIANYVATVEVKHAEDLTLKAVLDMVEHKVIVDHAQDENAQAFLEINSALHARVRAQSGGSIRASIAQVPDADGELEEMGDALSAEQFEEEKASEVGTPRAGSTSWIKSPRPPGFVKKQKPTAWVCGPHGCGIRSQPSLDDADKNGGVLKPAEVFLVSEELPSPDGEALLLRLADGRGWAFDHKPNSKFGAVCRRAEEKEATLAAANLKKSLAQALDTDVDECLREIRRTMALAEVDGDGSQSSVALSKDEQAAFALQNDELRREVKSMVMSFADKEVARPEEPEVILGIMLKQASDFFGRWSLRVFEVSQGKVRYWLDLTSKRQNFRPKYEYNLLNATISEGGPHDSAFVLSLKKDGDKLHKRPPYKLNADISRHAKAEEKKYSLGRNVWVTALSEHAIFAHEELVYRTAQKVAMHQRASVSAGAIRPSTS